MIGIMKFWKLENSNYNKKGMNYDGLFNKVFNFILNIKHKRGQRVNVYLLCEKLPRWILYS